MLVPLHDIALMALSSVQSRTPHYSLVPLLSHTPNLSPKATPQSHPRLQPRAGFTYKQQLLSPWTLANTNHTTHLSVVPCFLVIFHVCSESVYLKKHPESLSARKW